MEFDTRGIAREVPSTTWSPTLPVSPAVPRKGPRRWCVGFAEVAKQSRNTLLDICERYIKGYMTLFDTI